MIIATSIVIVALAALLFTLMRKTEVHPVPHRQDPARDRALWVAREQLTAGRIDAGEYERIVQALSR